MPADIRLTPPSTAERYGLVLEEEPYADPRILADVEGRSSALDRESRFFDALGVGLAFTMLSAFTMLATRLARWLLV